MIVIVAIITIFSGVGGIYAMSEFTERRKQKHILKMKELEIEALKLKQENRI